MMRCGFYEKDITPPLGCNIPGYFARRVANGVTTPLYAKALAVESDGKCVIIISVDAICTPPLVHDIAVQRIESAVKVPSDRVLISATHTHTGGPVAIRNELYPSPYFTPDWMYTEQLGKAVGDCGILAYQRLMPMTSKIAKGEVIGLTFNRNYIMKDGTVRTNPGDQSGDVMRQLGVTDPELPVIFFFNENGNPAGALVNFATHHDSTCIGSNDTFYCSDYSGALANNLKKIYGSDLVTVFLNGACGNINHFDIRKPMEYYYKQPYYLKIAERLAAEIVALSEKLVPFEISAVDGKKERLKCKRRSLSDETLAEYEELYRTVAWENVQSSAITSPDTREYKRLRAETFLNFAALPETEMMNIQAVRLGDCAVFAMPGEIYAEFGILAKKLSPLPYNMVAEMANGDVVGSYVPTPEAFGTEIYEAQITSAEFAPETGEEMARFAARLAKSLI